jgi:2'-5' RNA ligase
MRLFLAADLDDRLRQVAGRETEGLRRGWRPQDSGALKWVDAANLHVTLHFLGEIDDGCVPGLVEVLSPPLAAPPFDLGLGQGGVFPPTGPPRVVWIGVSRGASALTAIHRELAWRLTSARIDVDDRPWQAHITVARVKQPMRSDLRALASGIALDGAGCCRVDAVTLYRSHLGPGGATYAPQLTIPLGRP